MDIKLLIAQLLPCWIMGMAMIWVTWNSQYREILQIKIKPILTFLKILAAIAAYRFLTLTFLTSPSVIEATRISAHIIPLPLVFGVFWEDACHSMPLVLMGSIYGSSRWYPWLSKIMLVVVMAAFGIGHLYQGVFAAIVLSFGVPFSMAMGKKYGFATVMICHILYDLSTLLSIRWILG